MIDFWCISSLSCTDHLYLYKGSLLRMQWSSSAAINLAVWELPPFGGLCVSPPLITPRNRWSPCSRFEPIFKQPKATEVCLWAKRWTATIGALQVVRLRTEAHGLPESRAQTRNGALSTRLRPARPRQVAGWIQDVQGMQISTICFGF